MIKFFATLKDLAGMRSLELPLSTPITIEDLRQQLAAQFPALAPALPSAIAAVNQEYVFAEHVIHPNDEVAFFPPVSGGDFPPDYYALVEGPVDLNSLTQRIVSPHTGAVTLFSGFVRGQTHEDGTLRQTARLEYEAYKPMALAKMAQVAQEIRQRWPAVQSIAIVQSVGVLQVGQPTVLIACATGHRDEGGFEAARYGIDRLKEIVPVWKKEIGSAGEVWIEGGYHPSAQDVNPPGTVKSSE
jgi:molybdopterin synthase catalytic subunit